MFSIGIVVLLGVVELATVDDFRRAATAPPKLPEIATPGPGPPATILAVLGLGVLWARFRR